MKAVFADSLYWIAIVKPGDPWANAAKIAKSRLGEVRIVTTDEVLTEFLTALSGAGETLRQKAAEMVRAILSNPNVKVVPQSRGTFLHALDLFGQRGDKEYSPTDCVSMNTMKVESLLEILTNDHHFEQEGFTILMKKQD
jgi:predicted nucleic acid-binding protein